MHAQTGGKTDRWMERGTDRYADIQKGDKIFRQTERRTKERQIDRWVLRQSYRQ